MDFEKLQQRIAQLEKAQNDIDGRIKELNHQHDEMYLAIEEEKVKYVLDSGILTTLNWEVALWGQSIVAPYDNLDLKKLFSGTYDELILQAKREGNCISRYVKLSEYNNHLTISAYNQELLLIKNCCFLLLERKN